MKTPLSDKSHPQTDRINKEEPASMPSWPPELSQDLRNPLTWLSRELLTDPELADVVSNFIRRAGYKPPVPSGEVS